MTEDKELTGAYDIRCWHSVVQEIEHEGGKRDEPLVKVGSCGGVSQSVCGKIYR